MQKEQKNYKGIDVSKPYFDASLLTVADHKMANKELKQLLHLCALSAIKYY